MSTWRTELVGALFTGALVLSCGGPPEPDAVPGQEEPSDVVEPSPGATGTDPPGSATDPTAPSRPQPQAAPQPADPVRPGGAPPSAAQPANPGGSGRPGGAPPGVRHDLPQVEDPYDNKEGWLSNIADACGEVGEPETCLSLSIQFFENSEDGRRSISDPGSEYQELYEYCEVAKVDPPSDPPRTVPSGTRIAVEVVCGPPLEPDTGTDPDSEPGTEQDQQDQQQNDQQQDDQQQDQQQDDQQQDQQQDDQQQGEEQQGEEQEQQDVPGEGSGG